MSEEAKPLEVGLAVVPPGITYKFDIDRNDDTKAVETLNEILAKAKAPLIAEIESLKKRLLTADELRRFINLLKLHPSETRFDGRPTNDDLLVSRLEGILKN
jgi:hypothetical protein